LPLALASGDEAAVVQSSQPRRGLLRLKAAVQLTPHAGERIVVPSSASVRRMPACHRAAVMGASSWNAPN
jgi:hypothetical protein